MKNQNLYSAREVLIIMNLKAQGFTLNEIAEITGRSVNSLVYKFRDVKTKIESEKLAG